MSEDRWNSSIRLYPTDRLFLATFSRLIPRSVSPNALTWLRLLLIVPILYSLSVERYDVGVPLFLFAALTDWFDGALARTRRQVTQWGVVYDPLVDKLLIGSVLFVIVLQHVNFVLGISLLGVEATIILLALRARLSGAVQPANVWGKIKMVAEVSGVLLLLIALWFQVDLFVDLSNGTLAVALVFALISVFSRMF